jgi:hypothetical protein
MYALSCECVRHPDNDTGNLTAAPIQIFRLSAARHNIILASPRKLKRQGKEVAQVLPTVFR